MAVKIHTEVVQGSDEWLELRRGLLTASEMSNLFTAKLAPSNARVRQSHIYDIAAQRITGVVDPHYVGDEMLRGHAEEAYARMYYENVREPVDEVAFITNDKWGFTLGYSPDGLVGLDGAIEAKSRRSKFQVQTVVEGFDSAGACHIPEEYKLQCQTGLLVSEREWIDFLSFSNGMPMPIMRVFPDPHLQALILEAASAFEADVQKVVIRYREILATQAGALVPTERYETEEIIV